MPLQATSGAASYDAFGGGVAAVPTFIEDVFSCFLYTGTSASLTITNNIDLSTKGGFVWIKNRSSATHHRLFDTARGATKYLSSGQTSASATDATSLTAFNSTGFSLGDDSSSGDTVNFTGNTYVSWTFRKQPKFFDVVTYTGTGSAQNISHALGSVPGCIIVKRTNTAGFDWIVYHRSTGNTNRLLLNDTAGAASGTSFWNDTTPTSTVFTVGSNVNVNQSGGSYVAYIFAHDAGGFGLTGTDNVISCGSYTGVTYPNSLEVTLGYEPQFVIIKNSNTVSGWTMWDIMRGMAVVPAANTAQALLLEPNTSAADSNQPGIFPTATGFVVKNGLTSISSPSDKMIYIAIRRGPMKVPTDATKVYNGVNNNSGLINVGFVPDLALINTKAQWDRNPAMARLTGTGSLRTNATNAEETQTIYWDKTTGYFEQAATGGTPMSWFFGRAPSYMDVVCYTGTGSALSVSHNLQAVPELMIVKRRNSATYGDWYVYTAFSGNAKYQALNSTIAATSAGIDVWSLTNPTSTIMSVGSDLSFSASTYVAYLFATCAGVSKVGSYTGTATTKQIDCGFTGGARFVLIKRTDSTGDWYVWDSARGIVSGNDPYLLLNSTAAEVTNTDYVDTYSAGFEISSTAPAAINASGGNFVFLAIA